MPDLAHSEMRKIMNLFSSKTPFSLILKAKENESQN